MEVVGGLEGILEGDTAVGCMQVKDTDLLPVQRLYGKLEDLLQSLWRMVAGLCRINLRINPGYASEVQLTY